MHDLEGLFCKTGSLWIIHKFADAGKKMSSGPNLAWPTGAGALEAHHGPWPEGEAGRAGPGAAGSPRSWPARSTRGWTGRAPLARSGQRGGTEAGAIISSSGSRTTAALDGKVAARSSEAGGSGGTAWMERTCGSGPREPI